MDKDEIRKKADEIWKRAPKKPGASMNLKPLVFPLILLVIFISLFFGYRGIGEKEPPKTPIPDAPKTTGDPRPNDKEVVIDIPVPRLDPKDLEKPVPPPGEDPFPKSIEADLEAIDNATVIDAKNVNLLYLTSVVQQMPAAECALRVDPRLTIDDLYKNPKAHRGKFVRLRGRSAYESCGEEPVYIPTAKDLRRIFWGMVFVDASKNQRVFFYTPEDPIAVIPRKKIDRPTDATPVEIEGMFLRVYEYFDTENNRLKAAVVAVKTIRRVGQQEEAQLAANEETIEKTKTLINVIIILGAVILVAVILGAGIMQKKRDSASIRGRIDKMKRDLLIKEGRLRKPSDSREEIIGDPMPKSDADETGRKDA